MIRMINGVGHAERGALPGLSSRAERAPGASPSATPPADPAALEKVAKQLQSVFAEQLFKAMRETVPRGEGAVDGGGGEEMFTGLMDQHVAADTPSQWARGLTDAIVRQLGKQLGAGAPAPDAAGTAAALPPSAPPAFPLTDVSR